MRSCARVVKGGDLKSLGASRAGSNPVNSGTFLFGSWKNIERFRQTFWMQSIRSSCQDGSSVCGKLEDGQVLTVNPSTNNVRYGTMSWNKLCRLQPCQKTLPWHYHVTHTQLVLLDILDEVISSFLGDAARNDDLVGLENVRRPGSFPPLHSTT